MNGSLQVVVFAPHFSLCENPVTRLNINMSRVAIYCSAQVQIFQGTLCNLQVSIFYNFHKNHLNLIYCFSDLPSSKYQSCFQLY